MFCLQCGAQNDDRSLYCYKCGKPLVQKSEPVNTNESVRRKKAVKEEESSGWDAQDFMANEEEPMIDGYGSGDMTGGYDETEVLSSQAGYDYDNLSGAPTDMNHMQDSNMSQEMNGTPYGNTVPEMSGTPYGNTVPEMNGVPYGNTAQGMNGPSYDSTMQNMNGMQGYPQQKMMQQQGPKVLTGGRAFGIMCLNFLHLIPILGTIAYIIIMIVLACSKKDPNRAAMCKGVILWFFVPIILTIIFIIIFGGTIAAVLAEYGLI